VRPRVASAGAVAAGFLVTAVASTAADAVMHAAGIFPSSPMAMSDPLFALASAYRALFTVAGGYATACLAPDRPMRHAWILAGIGLVAGLAPTTSLAGRSSARPGTRFRSPSRPSPASGWAPGWRPRVDRRSSDVAGASRSRAACLRSIAATGPPAGAYWGGKTDRKEIYDIIASGACERRGGFVTRDASRTVIGVDLAGRLFERVTEIVG
jgi:hypothetical protein